MKLEKLIPIDVREVWKREDKGFNQWLANKGLELLIEELGFESAEVEQIEANVGDFFVDLVVKVSDFESEKILVIESQLSKTDHDHLGKLITYSAMLDAEYVIWIAPRIRDEHRKAVDWLNEIAESSDKNMGFFLVKIEVWKIGDSNPAPKFSIVSAPNDWVKTVKKKVRDTRTLGEKAKIAYDFLSGFYEFISDRVSNARSPSISTPNFYEFRIGTSKAAIRVGVNVSEKYLRIGLVFVKELFESFKKFEDELKEIFKEEEFRLESPENYRRYAFADVFKHDVDLKNRSSWEDLYEWLYRSYEKLKRFFENRKEVLLR